MKRIVLIIALCVNATFAHAQDDDDKGMLTRFLQDSLSGAGREVSIDGFAGALSSRATIERMTFSDDKGVWFIITNVALDWNRLRVLRGEIDINELSAETLEIKRPPETPGQAPSPEASVFSLPDLPVSVDIDKIAIGSLILDEPVLGEKFTATLDGTMKLEGGTGSADISLNRTDDKTGAIKLAGGFDNETRQLQLDLSVKEGAGGILSEKIGLPGDPSVDFEVTGDDPLSDFTGTLRLATDDVERFAGTVTILSTQKDGTDITEFRADLGGDISPLFEPDYQSFFGDDTALIVNGSKETGGRLILDELTLDTAAFDIRGSVTLSADGFPEQFDVDGTLRSGTEVAALLPIPGERVQLKKADFSANYQAGESDDWSFKASFDEFEQGPNKVGSGMIDAVGKIKRDGQITDQTQSLRNVSADVSAQLADFTSDDPAMSRAFGQDITAKTNIVWSDGDPVKISGLNLQAAGSQISGKAEIAGKEQNLRITGDLAVETDDLSRYSDLVGQDIAGRADLTLGGWFEPLGNAFDIALDMQSNDLSAGPEQVRDLLKGVGTLNLKVTRDLTGLDLKAFSVKTDALAASANGRLQSSDSDLTFEARLTDIANFAEGFSGPVTLQGTAKQNGQPWSIDASGTGPVGTQMKVSGTLKANDSTGDLKITGDFPLGLVNKFLPSDILINGKGVIDLALVGPLALDSVTGGISTNDAAVSLPTLNLSLPKLTANARLNGNSAQIEANADVSRGGTISANGTIGLAAPFTGALKIAIRNMKHAIPPTVTTELGGDLTINGPLATGPRVAGEINLLETELRLIPISGGGSVPDIRHVGESASVDRTQNFAGFVLPDPAAKPAKPYNANLDVTVVAPNRIFIRGNGLEAEMQGRLRLTGTSSSIIPIGRFSLIRGRLDILGQRLDLVEGELYMQGSFDPYFRVVAQTRKNGTTLQAIVEGDPSDPKISFVSQPYLPEDEVLAELLFGKPIDEMSPLEAANLAREISRLAGGPSEGLISSIRKDAGLDAFGVTTSQDGNLALEAGKYLSENVYADVTVDAEGKSRVDLNLEITSDFNVRGSADSQGNTGIGIFFEKDY
ncbi:MAG: translocation/assembly module TamB domain-containing protein [Marinosulfonomonas sp.]